MKKIISVLLTLTIAFGLFTAMSVPVSAAHSHEAADYYQYDATGHWNPCFGDGDCQEKLNYQEHDTSKYEKYCEVCKNRIDHVCYNPEATCQNGGRCIYCPFGAPVNPDNHNTYGAMIDDKTHKVVCDCGYVKVASEPHVLNSWAPVDGKPDIEESWCEVCFHAVTRKKQTSTSGNSNTGNGGNNNSTTGNGGSNGNSGNSGNDGNNSGNGSSNEQSSVPSLESNGVVQPETSSPTETDGATDGSTGTESETDNNVGNTDGDKDNGKGGSLLWLWILLIIIAVGGTVTAVVLVKKKKQ